MHVLNQKNDVSWLLILYVVLFPFAIGIVGPSFIISDVFLLGFIGVCLAKNLAKKSFQAISFDVLFLLLVAATLTGAGIATHLKAYLFELGSLVFMYLGARCIAAEISTADRLNSFVELVGKMFLIFLLFSFAVIVLRNCDFKELTDYFFASGNRFKGIFNFTNQLSIFLICLWPLAALSLRKSRSLRFVSYLAYLVCLSYIGSRSGFWIGITQTALIEIFIPERKGSSILALNLALLAAIVFLVISFTASEVAMQRSLGDYGHGALELDEARVNIFRQAFNVSEFWLLGYGLGCFDQNHRHEVHNTPFSILVETGLAGFVIASIFTLIFLYALFKAPDLAVLPKLHTALFISLAGMASVGMVIYLLRTRSCWLVFAIALAFIKIERPSENVCNG